MGKLIPHGSRRDEDAAPQDEGQAIRSSIVSDLNFKELATTAPRSRGAFRPSCARNLPPSPIRGRRECRAPDAPAAACAVVESTRVSHHGHTGNTRHSPRNGFTAYFALSPVTGLSCHCRRRDAKHHRQLDASVGASGPHDFAVRRITRSSATPPASIASRPAFVTIASRPSCRSGTAGDVLLIWVGGEAENFPEGGWTATQISPQPASAPAICGQTRTAGIAEPVIGWRIRAD